MTTTTADIENAITNFLEDWDRNQWQQDNGEWESEKWESERAEYDSAKETLESAVDEAQSALKSAPSGNRADPKALAETRQALEAAMVALDAAEAAAKALDSQVTPDESDYIAEGLIDPDNVSNEAVKLNVGHHWQGWDCREGWDAYRHGSSLYMRWWRDAYGNRHDRDLWVEVSSDMFESDDEEESASEEDEEETDESEDC